MIKLIITTTLFLLIALVQFTSINAASFEMDPFTSNFDCGQPSYFVDIYIDIPLPDESNAADIEIFYDPTIIDILDANPIESGTQIVEGTAFQRYWGNITDESTGKILLSGGSVPDNSILVSGRQLFGQIEFSPVDPFTTSTFTFDIRFDGVGNTIDSNIANAVTGDDLLTNEIDGNYTFTFTPIDPCINISAPVTTPSGGSSGDPEVEGYPPGFEFPETDPDITIVATPPEFTQEDEMLIFEGPFNQVGYPSIIQDIEEDISVTSPSELISVSESDNQLRNIYGVTMHLDILFPLRIFLYFLYLLISALWLVGAVLVIKNWAYYLHDDNQKTPGKTLH